MSKSILVLKVENPHFTVRLYENLLRVDLKGSLKSELEEALENKPILKETLGGLLSIFVPLHIRLSDIDSVQMDETGKVTVNLPYHRHILIPLERKHAEEFVNKLNQLIQRAKDREIKERIMKKRAKRKIKRKQSGIPPPSSYLTVPYYFPTEQVDIVDKLRRKKKKGKK
ncbi:MAG: hypothetical protein QXX51_08060 [Candidatus Bathyarchaeia archaeon]